LRGNASYFKEGGVSGIVRAARRPAGWIAPGPPPARLDLRPGPGEDLCYLAGDWRILQRLDGHRWSLDDLVTAWCAAREIDATPPARFADLGCGIGTVLMLLAWRFPAARGVGVEAQEVSVDLARRSLVVNGAAERCEVRHDDLRDASALPEGAVFDLVTGTPPYLPPGTATESTRVQRGSCTVERRGGIEDYCIAAARLLAPGGRFVVCEAAAQTARVEAAATAAGLGIDRRLEVIPRAGKAALFAVYAMRAAPAERIAVEPPLVVRDERGRRTEAFVAVRRAMGMPP
jgi:tRNA1(Val) A37 N6-methylase TrmN6